MHQELPRGCSLTGLNIKGDERGSLIALEGERNLPFPIARIYYVFDTLVGVSRGFHAHRKLNQLVIAVSGSCTMTVDDGSRRTDVLLHEPGRALMMEPMVWHEMHDFSPGCVLPRATKSVGMRLRPGGSTSPPAFADMTPSTGGSIQIALIRFSQILAEAHPPIPHPVQPTQLKFLWDQPFGGGRDAKYSAAK